MKTHTNKTKIILGPPGTGKTTRLLDIIEQELKNGCEPNKLLFSSFTKKAVNEAIARVIDRFGYSQDDLGFFKTIHSLAFNQLGLKKSQVMQSSDYKKIGDHLGLSFTSNVDVTQDISFGKTNGDYYIFINTFSKAKGITDQEVWDSMDHFNMNWYEYLRFKDTLEQYKEMYNKIDFADMLTCKVTPLDIDVAIIDEAQDLSVAQWDFIKNLTVNAKTIYIAGDDDQSIYAWSGADTHRFLNLKGDVEILHQSHRIPKQIHKLASTITSKISNRAKKDYLPKNEKGSVDYWNYIDHIDMSSGSWFLLTRNTYLLNEVVCAVREKGINYTIKNKTATDNDQIRAITAWEKWRAGKQISSLDENAIGEYLPREYKKWPADKIWHEALVGISVEDREYYISLLRRGESLSKNPRVVINTIHAVKGGEADNVVLITDVAYSTWAAANINSDAEHRVWYVGATRARQNLHIVLPRGKYHYDI